MLVDLPKIEVVVSPSVYSQEQFGLFFLFLTHGVAPPPCLFVIKKPFAFTLQVGHCWLSSWSVLPDLSFFDLNKCYCPILGAVYLQANVLIQKHLPSSKCVPGRSKAWGPKMLQMWP